MIGIAKSIQLFREQYLLFSVKRNNQYRVRIYRAAPEFDTETSIKITDMIREVTIIHDGIETKATNIGNAIMNTHTTKQAGELEITFLETKDLDVYKFLALKNDGTPIIPIDGTSLMPFEYYFYIEVIHQDTGMYSKLLDTAVSFIFGSGLEYSKRGSFIIDGNISHSYVAGEPELQTVKVTFKKLRTWEF